MLIFLVKPATVDVLCQYFCSFYVRSVRMKKKKCKVDNGDDNRVHKTGGLLLIN